MSFNSGFRAKRANDTQGMIGPQSQFLQKTYPRPFITGYTISGTDDTALDPVGGQTILVNGGNFATGVSAIVDGTQISSVTLISDSQLSFTSVAKPSGSYTLVIYNTLSDAAAILVPGLIYSGVPQWTTPAGSIGSTYETKAINTSVSATSDSAITYTLTSGSLPTGSTLYANGVITGTAPVDSGSTTYTFAVTATDAELQDTTRTFTLTINTDVVTWNNPANGATITLDGTAYSTTLSATSAAGYNVSYTANALPTGLTLSGNTISGTSTVEGTTTTLLTATAATTNRNATTTITWVVSLGDTYFNYVTTLLSATVSALPFNDDASTNNFAVTINGDTKPNNFNPYSSGYYSYYFNGTSDIVQIAPNTALDFGNGDFTIEFWMYAVTWGTTTAGLIGKKLSDTNAGWQLYRDSGTPTKINARLGSANNFYPTSTVTVGVWEHWALVRSGTTTYWFKNGVLDATGTNSVTLSDTSASFNIGYADTWSAYGANVYLSNLRIVKGTALYTSSFNPSTSPLTAVANTVLLTCQSNRVLDNSANKFAFSKSTTAIKPSNPFVRSNSYVNYGSTYFDGNGDYLTAASNAAFGFGTGDFTIECWIYPTNAGAALQQIYDNRTATADTKVNFGVRTNTITYCVGSATLLTSATSSIVNNAWQHVAIVKFSGITKIYINGTQSGSSYTDTYNFTSPAECIIATPSDAKGSATYSFAGYISDTRVTKGFAVYTANFTPPTSPLTAIANTSLLTCQTNQPVNNNVFLDNSSNNFLVTRYGNTTQGTFSPYGENWSNYFDGSGDYLSGASWSSAGNFGTGDFTVECWVYATDAPQSNQVIWSCNIYPNTTGLYLTYNSGAGSGLNVRVGSTGGPIDSSSGWAFNTWLHVAVVRSSGTLKLYINGVNRGSASFTNNCTDGLQYIGRPSDVANFMMQGYISNFRITKSAVYTTNFTPSTTPLQPIAGTILLTCKSPMFVDNSANNFAITRNGDVSVQKFSPFAGTTLPTPYYSALFDNSNYITAADNTELQLGTGDFTIEFWTYRTATQTYYGLFNKGSEYGLDNDSSRFVYRIGGGNGFVLDGDVDLNAWTHIALVKNGATTTLYKNGVSLGTSSSVISNSTNALNIGYCSSGNNAKFPGYITNFRIVKGTAVYTANFTPPTSPLTAISGTSLLACQSNTLIDSSANNIAITVTGTIVKPTTVTPFTVTYSTKQSYTPAVYGGSMYFDGTGDYVTVSTLTPATALASGNWTIECWFYASATKTFAQIIGNRSSATGNTGYVPIVVSYESATIKFYSSNNGSSWNILNATTIGTVTLQTWNHVAVVRNGNNLDGYLNGIKVSLSTALSGVSYTATNLFYASGVTDPFQGYISDVRLISGTALYTSSFALSNSPLTAIKNTTLLLNGTSAGIYDSSEMNNFETVGDAKLSTSVVKYGNTSMYFDGTGDYMLTKLDSLYDIWRGDLTVEGWFYFNSVANAPHLFNIGESSSARCTLYVSSSVLRFYTQVSTGADRITSSTTLVAGQWYHVALTKSGTTFTLWLNGISQGTSTTTVYPYGLPESVCIGFQNFGGGAGDYLNGYTSDFRITKGYARYTSNFTPPTSPFTN